MTVSKNISGEFGQAAESIPAPGDEDIYVPLGKPDPSSDKVLVYVGRHVPIVHDIERIQKFPLIRDMLGSIVEMNNTDLEAYRRSPHKTVIEPRELANPELFKDRLAKQAFSLYEAVHDRARIILGDNAQNLDQEHMAIMNAVYKGGSDPKPRGNDLDLISKGIAGQGPTLGNYAYLNRNYPERQRDLDLTGQAYSMHDRIMVVPRLQGHASDLRRDLQEMVDENKVDPAFAKRIIDQLDGPRQDGPRPARAPSPGMGGP